MTDIGHTAIQVSPEVHTEADMNKLSSIFSSAANAIIRASDMAKQVAILQTQVDDLQAQVNTLRATKESLEYALNEASHAKVERDAAQQERDTLKSVNNANKVTIDSLTTTLAEAKHDRDEHGFRVLELEDQLKLLTASLNKIKAVHASIFGEPDTSAMQPAPEPVVIVGKEWTHPDTLNTGAGVVETKVEPFVEPPSAEEEHKPQAAPARNYRGTSWSPGLLWDTVKGQYYDEGQH